MVFRNMGETTSTGVVFTRDPSTGEQGLFGEFLLNAQGEDVVAGIRIPRPIAEMEEPLPHAFEEPLYRVLVARLAAAQTALNDKAAVAGASSD